MPKSKQLQAFALLQNTTLKKSNYWPSVDTALFLQNLQRNIEQPVYLYAGRNTNFCAFAIVGYVISREDPLGYVQFMIDLYKHGKATYANVNYNPSAAVRTEAGTILYEGELDRNDADHGDAEAEMRERRPEGRARQASRFANRGEGCLRYIRPSYDVQFATLSRIPACRRRGRGRSSAQRRRHHSRQDRYDGIRGRRS